MVMSSQEISCLEMSMKKSNVCSVFLGFPRAYCPKLKSWIDVLSRDGCQSCGFFISDKKSDDGIEICCSYTGEKKYINAYFRCSCPKLSKWNFVNHGEGSCSDCEYCGKIRIFKTKSETECFHPDAFGVSILKRS